METVYAIITLIFLVGLLCLAYLIYEWLMEPEEGKSSKGYVTIWIIKLGNAVCPHRFLNRDDKKYRFGCRVLGKKDCTYEQCPYRVEI